MTRKLAYALIIILSVIIVGGIVLGVFVLTSQDEFTKNITLGEDGSVSEEINVSLVGFYPGHSVEYTINFGSSAAFGYDASISFEADGDCSLAEYIVVDMTLNGQSLNDGTLKDFIDGQDTVFSLENLNDGGAALVIKYTMPSEVGNEAQGTVANFNVVVTAQPKG